MTPHGRAKALQHGATAADIAESIESCTMCGACEPACPENIDLIGMIAGLRRQLPQPIARPAHKQVPRDIYPERSRRARDDNWNEATPTSAYRAAARSAAGAVLLAGRSLRDRPATLARVVALLGLAVAVDDGADISFALETGSDVSAQRVDQFLAPLRRRRRLVVADGLLLRHLRGWLPRAPMVSLGVALSNLPGVRRSLRSTDLYVIEPRAYHADYERQVRHYDTLRAETGCAINLDLQRIAVPATARSLPQCLGFVAPDDAEHARWILHGRRVSRIVVESPDDIDAFEQISDCPVTHIAHVADDAHMAQDAPC